MSERPIIGDPHTPLPKLATAPQMRFDGRLTALRTEQGSGKLVMVKVEGYATVTQEEAELLHKMVLDPSMVFAIQRDPHRGTRIQIYDPCVSQEEP